jgi:hypothetical protein
MVVKTPPDILKLALWATSLSPVLSNLNAWVGGVDRMMARAAAQGASLLMLPELLCEQWLVFAPREPNGQECGQVPGPPNICGSSRMRPPVNDRSMKKRLTRRASGKRMVTFQ